MWIVVLLCAGGVRQIFSDESLYHNDSKRVREKVFQNEAEPNSEKYFWTSGHLVKWSFQYSAEMVSHDIFTNLFRSMI